MEKDSKIGNLCEKNNAIHLINFEKSTVNSQIG